MAWLWFLSLLLFGYAKGELGLPHFPPQQVEAIPTLDISQDDVREALSYAQDQQQMRKEIENKYVESGNTIPPTQLSMDIRIIGFINPKAMEIDRNQKLFEDATTWLSKKHNLSADDSRLGLENIHLPENLPVVQQCKSLKKVGPCDEKSKYRTLDGSCNNLLIPNWGQTHTCYNRLMKSDYADGLSSPRRSDDGSELPNGRLVSLTVVDDKDVPSPVVSQMFLGFAHFLSHDVSLAVGTLAGDSGAYLSCCPKNESASELPAMCYPVPLQNDDPDFSKLNRSCISLVRYAACSESCKLGTPRRNVNQHTSFVDASNVYGLTENETRVLRTLKGGAFIHQTLHSEEMPPYSYYPKVDQCSTKNHTCLQAGDYRAIQIIGVTSVHILFFREHNRLAKIISRDYPQLTDEEVFQEVRRIIIAEIQLVTYYELLPLIIGKDLMEFYQLNDPKDGYSSYNPDVDPRVFSEHAVTSARFGHSLVQKWYKQFDKDGNEEEELDLESSMFMMPKFFEGKMDSLTRGLCRQSTQSFDRHFVSPMTTGGIRGLGIQDGIDHIAMIIQRGRETGLPSYIEVLHYCYNVTITSFDDLKTLMSEENALRLQKAYSNVKEIDLYLGGFLEYPIKDSVNGPTFACLTGKQYHNLKFGDRYYFQHRNQAGSFSKGQLKELSKLTFARIVCDNSGAGKVTRNVFHAFDTENPLVDCTDIPSLDFKNWLNK